MIADKGYDSEALREQIVEQGGHPVIPRKKNSRKGNGDLDRGLCKLRHLVENAFARLKYFRGVATRYVKLKKNFISSMALACIFILLPT